MKESWRKFKDVTCGRWAISMIGFLLTVPYGLLVAIERETRFDPSSGIYQAFLICSAGYFITFLYVFTLQTTLLRERVYKPQPLYKCIFTWYSAGFVLGLSTASYAKLAFGSDWEIVARTIMSTVYTGTALALSAYYLGTVGRFTEENRALSNLGQLLESDASSIGQKRGEFGNSTATVYLNLIQPEIKKIDQSLKEIQKNLQNDGLQTKLSLLKEKTQELQELIVEKMQTAYVAAQDKPDSWRIKLGDESVIKELIPRIMSVRISIIIILFGGIAGQLPRNGLNGVVASLCGTVIIGMGLYLLSIFYKKEFVQGGYFLRVAFFVIAFAIQVLWTHFQPYIGFDLDAPYNPFYSGLKTIYGIYISSIIASIIVFNARLKISHQDFQEAVRSKIDKENLELDELKEEFEEIRYGRLLGKFGGAVMALNILNEINRDDLNTEHLDLLMPDLNQLLFESISIIKGTKIENFS